jgi:hypothetical protein
MIAKDFGENLPKLNTYFFSYKPTIYIRDPKLLEELYVKHNKYFDKYPVIKNLLNPLMGDSILLS